ncbi:hypothetical protein DIT71_17020 [Marinobacter vulgaris]|uniref:Glycosyltransferase 2-like domain-containing protein n=1 Tax=Marinobacter vulgaris TaxID=1928331 RepID=A0A2V3ZFA2_9GAMM|nr:glycosyltransferase [Marinobacter vulgaris]PXX88888.1 hypothetical protein DIT71_17020 [Marinobacter vulgaris]TSJ66681.1 glycosyltransferase [Marinobacter vulgaris]
MQTSISFIVIGKNESKHLINCFDSINRLKFLCTIFSFETIYVDSASVDNSIELALDHTAIDKVFRVDGCINAAIARNVGAENSTGTILCFLDADMELFEDEFSSLLEQVVENDVPFASGDLLDIEYDAHGSVESERRRYNIDSNRYEITTGGLFVINRDTWDSVNGMRNTFRRNQDLDLGLRLAKSGVKMLRIGKVIAAHHTVSYVSNDRFSKDLMSGNFLYPGVLIRKNFFNKYAHRHLYKSYCSSMFLLASLFQSLMYNSIYFIALYMTFWSIKKLYSEGNVRGIGRYMLRRLSIDASFFIGFLAFYPSSKYKSKFRVESFG